MLGLDGAGAAVADDLKLRVRLRLKEEGAGEEQRYGELADDIHSASIVGLGRGGFVTRMSRLRRRCVAVLDHDAAVHDDADASGFGAGGGFEVYDSLLDPETL